MQKKINFIEKSKKYRSNFTERETIIEFHRFYQKAPVLVAFLMRFKIIIAFSCYKFVKVPTTV